MKTIIFRILILILVQQVITKSLHKRNILTQPDLLKAVNVYCLTKSNKLCSEENRQKLVKIVRERQENLLMQREMDRMKETITRILSEMQ